MEKRPDRMIPSRFARLFVWILIVASVADASIQRRVDEEAAGNTGGSSSANTSPVVIGTCDSTWEDAEMMVELTPELTFHWTVVEDANPSTLDGVLEYNGEGWLGFGVSPNGGMVGSTAIIGLPGSGNEVEVYNLGGKDVSAVTPVESSELEKSVITQAGGKTILRFVLAIDDSDGGVTANGLNTFIYAIGSSNELAYHQHRGSFRIDINTCQESSSGSNGFSTMTKQGAFLAHGTLAVLAWGVATPFALTVAWFRTLVPSSWIYIHVFSNVISFLFTVVAVIVAIVAKSAQSSPSHFSEPHHIVGVVLLVAMTFQVMNGFMRPPVEKRDPYYMREYVEEDEGFIKFPKTPREVWYFLHRLTGISMMAMGVYQIVSGLNLYAEAFNVTSVASWFWLYFGVFAFFLISLKVWIMVEEYKARQGAALVDHHEDYPSSGSGSSYDMEQDSHSEMVEAGAQFVPA